VALDRLYADVAKFNQRIMGPAHVDNPADCGRMLEEALATPGPVVVQGVVDPFEPPLPAKVTLDQAAKFARSLLRGEPNSQKLVLSVLGERIRELV
jgi:pyruvate dehydrogenase (quinone)/pyruvate oxidase